MSNINSVATIIGYALFAFSEIVAVLPIPANGVFHSLIIGLKNSATKIKSSDIEMAKTLITNKPDMANIITTLEGNPILIETVKIILANPGITKSIGEIANNNNLQFINTLLINNPDIINITKTLIIEKINDSFKINDTVPTNIGEQL